MSSNPLKPPLPGCRTKHSSATSRLTKPSNLSLLVVLVSLVGLTPVKESTGLAIDNNIDKMILVDYRYLLPLQNNSTCFLHEYFSERQSAAFLIPSNEFDLAWSAMNLFQCSDSSSPGIRWPIPGLSAAMGKFYFTSKLVPILRTGCRGGEGKGEGTE